MTTTSSSSGPAPAAAPWPGTWPRRASASCCWSGATGCPASRRTGPAADVFIDNRYISPDTWYDDKGKAFQPQVHYFVGGATKLYGAALYRLRREDFGELKHHDGLSPAWPIGYDEMEPYYTKAEQLYQVHGARGEDPTEPPASAPYPFPAVSHEPRIQQLVRRPRRRGPAPLPRPLRRHARRGQPAVQPLHPHARPATASRAWSTPSPTPRCWGCGRRWSTPTSPWSPTPGRSSWPPTTPAPPSPGSRSTTTGPARSSPPTCTSSRAAPPTRPSCSWPPPATPTPTAWPTGPTRSAATTCSTTARPCWPSPRSRTRPSSRRPSGSTTSTSAATTSSSRWATSR